MRRPIRYALALVVAVVVTFGVAVEHDSIFLFAGTFVTYALTAAAWLRYPSLLRPTGTGGGGRNVASGVVAGGTAFGVLSLANGVGEGFHLGAAVIGFGLAAFGVVGGIWIADEAETSFRPSESGVDPSGTRTESVTSRSGR